MPDNNYADVILPLALPKEYTFSIPDEFREDVIPGKRVIVQFGKRRIYTALIKKVHTSPPDGQEIKPVMEVLDDTPVIQLWQLEFWQWIAEYYMCTLGEVYKAALPSGLKLESETKIRLKAGAAFDGLTSAEMDIVRLLSSEGALSLSKMASALQKKTITASVKALSEKGIICMDEAIKSAYKPKYVDFIKLTQPYEDEDRLNHLLNKLARAPKQVDILMSYLSLSGYRNGRVQKEISRAEVTEKAGASSASMKGLIDKEVFEIYSKEVSRFLDSTSPLSEKVNLNDAQKHALTSIENAFETKDTVLLHGVTSSGKTEIYIHLIEKYINKGKQVLYLLPEIALTTQIITRLKNIFGQKVGIYHSKFSDSERVEVWKNLLGTGPDNREEYDIILGVRSSVFLPFRRLGLIIIDEEHENTYKQYDPAPRYHARDVSVMMSRIHKTKVLLGTATPSVETYYNTRAGKYELIELSERYLDIELPEIIVVDTLRERKKKLMQSHFSPGLIDKIKESLEKDEQIILFQNRRGFSPYIECDMCGWIPHCKHCDVSLTYHKTGNRLVCHYCGYSVSTPGVCSSCGSTAMQTRGFGTEKVEDEVGLIFPEANVARLDLDSARSRKNYEKIISDFEQGLIHILVGTQMITKGLDFENVGLVGILNADNMLNFPDFRSHERSFQLMTQVSGRAGRKKGRGLVIIQTSDVRHHIIKQVVHNDFRAMFSEQLKERDTFHYPPYFRLIRISIKHKKREVMNTAAKMLATGLRTIEGIDIIGPEYPLIGRMQTYYIKCIMVKIPRQSSLNEAKKRIQQHMDKLRGHMDFSSVIIQPDVDPY